MLYPHLFRAKSGIVIPERKKPTKSQDGERSLIVGGVFMTEYRNLKFDVPDLRSLDWIRNGESVGVGMVT